jgi:hypothetical protein
MVGRQFEQAARLDQLVEQGRRQSGKELAAGEQFAPGSIRIVKAGVQLENIS